ncbi:alkene reductase [Streptomyces sp. NPDC004647]|uniref:alkene reductase n=1 Tax=Streptomyces sp. NPDC004647 TaxID=3154671 RepID=UPI0033AD6C40
MEELFQPLTVGKLELPNRLIMAPMTRARASENEGLVNALTAEYYAQRADAGLIIAEGTQPSIVGQGYVNTPGLHSPEQVEAWRQVTDAVHGRGGRIFAQLMHCGRVGHPTLYPDRRLPEAPSEIPSGEQMFNGTTMLDHPTPRAMTLDDIARTIDDHVLAARNAIDAGFDGVELHGAFGYLIHQFLSDNSNQRTDPYGGSISNRIRFAVEVSRAVADAIGAERVGLRISPTNGNNGIQESDSADLYTALVHALAPYGLGYLHVVEFGNRDLTRQIRAAWPGTLILNPHQTPEETLTPESARAVLQAGIADAVSLAKMWLANPDLLPRIRAGGPYNTDDRDTWYGGDHRGYTDYPTVARA